MLVIAPPSVVPPNHNSLVIAHIAKRKKLILIRLNGISFFLKDLLFHFKDYILNQLTSCIAGSIRFSIALPNFLIFLSQDASIVRVVQPFHQIVFHYCLFVNVCPSLLIVSPFSFWLCQRGRVGKAAQLTPAVCSCPVSTFDP